MISLDSLNGWHNFPIQAMLVIFYSNKVVGLAKMHGWMGVFLTVQVKM